MRRKSLLCYVINEMSYCMYAVALFSEKEVMIVTALVKCQLFNALVISVWNNTVFYCEY